MKCHVTKPVSEYYVNHKNKHGHAYMCKACYAEKNRAFRQRRPDYDREYKRRMRALKKKGLWRPNEYNRVSGTESI